MSYTRRKSQASFEDLVFTDPVRSLKIIFTQNDELEDGTPVRHMSISAHGRMPTEAEVNEALKICGINGKIISNYPFTKPTSTGRNGLHVCWA